MSTLRRGLCVRCAQAALLFAFTACSLPIPNWGERRTVELLLPTPPPHWECFGPLPFLVIVPPTRSGEPPSMLRSEPGARSLSLTIEKRTNLPVLAYPLLSGRRDLLKPAGAVYPSALDDAGSLEISFRDGFLAALLFPLCANRDLVESVNVPRLRREIWERSGGDPWVLDGERILETLAYGSMRSDRIKARQCFDLVIEPSSGSWVFDDPFRPPAAASAEGPRLELMALPEGTHRLFRSTSPNAEERIDLSVSAEEWLWVDSVTGAGGFGRW